MVVLDTNIIIERVRKREDINENITAVNVHRIPIAL